MIRVGFIGSFSKDWMGGLNYFKNLLYALHFYQNHKLTLIVFTGKKTDIEIKNLLKPYAKIIDDSIFDSKSLKWFLMKLENKIFGTNFFLSNILKKYEIEILSHSSTINLNQIKTINWIPDFQHIHLEKMFSTKEVEHRNKRYLKIIKKSDLIVLSSYDSFQDFQKFSPNFKSKAKILRFVSQPNPIYDQLNESFKAKLLAKYEITSDFFYLPNQFWKHKNHMLIFKAINRLKKEGIEINVVCSGSLSDYRNNNYINEILEFIELNNLKSNIKLLGLVKYDEVFGLIKFSKAVINPSLFEGWSSTVEECKSVGKNMILSDLAVHFEQYPSATFFKREDEKDLANILKSYKKPNNNLNIKSLESRTKDFAETYSLICNELLNK